MAMSRETRELKSLLRAVGFGDGRSRVHLLVAGALAALIPVGMLYWFSPAMIDATQSRPTYERCLIYEKSRGEVLRAAVKWWAKRRHNGARTPPLCAEPDYPAGPTTCKAWLRDWDHWLECYPNGSCLSVGKHRPIGWAMEQRWKKCRKMKLPTPAFEKCVGITK